MRPLWLRLQAFGAYAGQEIIDFSCLGERRLFLIHGPTGAGKTTILDALCFALYGTASGDLREARNLRSDYAAPEEATEVELRFSVGERRLRVLRRPEQLRPKVRGAGLRQVPAEAALYEETPAGEELLAARWQEVTRRVEELLGFQAGQFRQVVLLPQGQFRQLLVAGSREREEILQSLFRTELYARLEQRLKDRAQEGARRFGALREEAAWLLQQAEAADGEALASRCAVGRQAAQEAQAALAAAVQEAAQRQGELAAAQQEAALFAERAAARAEGDRLQASAPAARELEGRLQLAQQAASLEDAWKQWQQQAAETASLGREEDRSRTAAAQAAAQLEAAQRQWEETQPLEARLQGYQARRQQLESQAGEYAAWQEAERTVRRLEESQAGCLREAAAREEAVRRQQAQEETQARRQQELAVLAAEAPRCEREAARRQGVAALVLRRDELRRRLASLRRQEEGAQQKRAAAAASLETARQHLLSLRQQWQQQQAAVLAAQLEEGSPCPVCGATHHPRPAVPASAAALGAVEEAEEAWRRLQEQEGAAAAEAARLQAAREAQETEEARLLAELGEDRCLADAAAQAQAELAAAQAAQAAQAVQEVAAWGQRQQERQRRLQEAQAAREQAAAALAEARGAQAAAAAVQAERLRRVPEEFRAPGAIDAALEAVRREESGDRQRLEGARRQWQQAQQDEAAAQALRLQAQGAHAQARQRLVAEESQWQRRLVAAGFAAQAQFEAARCPAGQRQQWQEAVQQRQQQEAAAADRLRRAAAAVEGRAEPDVAARQEALQVATAGEAQRREEAVRQQEAWQRDEAQLRRFAELQARLAEAEEAHGAVAALAAAAGGGNALNLTFQRYVLRTLLDDVVQEANLRLSLMSRGRYLLQRASTLADARRAGGLDLEVFDSYTGVPRPVGTLSGGESFLASLALALGLSDVVQAYAGGIRLDTILVDEGFGTLDPEALELAMRALIDLQRGGRLVGIISHVPELKERIDTRLEVVPGERGSRAVFHLP